MDLREIIEQAHMAGQHDAGVDAGYSNARAYCDGILEELEANGAKPTLCDVSAGRFISDHFELLRATINASDLWDYDTVVEFRRVCTECGISCEVIDGVLR